MADRQRKELHSKPSSSRPSPQGISLANLSEPLNFGPALVPTVQPIGVPESASSAVQRTPSSSSTISNTSGLFPLDHDAEADSFLGQTTPATSSFTGFGIPQEPKSTSLAPSSFASSTPQQGTRDGPKHFTMASSGQDVDNFLIPSKETPSTVSSLSSYSFQTPFSQHTGNTSLSSSQPSGIPQKTHARTSNLPSRRVYPTVNHQIGYSQPVPPQPTLPLSSQIPQYAPPTQSLAQGSQPISSPAMMTQVSAASKTQPLPQMYLPPQGSQQFGATQFPQQTSQVPILPVEQQFSSSSSSEGVVPTALIAPVQPHWFYLKENRAWMPFSYLDSNCLEHAYRLPNNSGDSRIVPTNGGRYDVNLDNRTREAVYWEEPATVVRRSTWFYKGEGGTKLIPYEENLAEQFENEFQAAVGQNLWPRRIDLQNGEYVILHNTNVMVHFQSGDVSEWTGEDIKARPKVMRRGIFDIEDDIEDGEPAQIDHLVFVIHGIGPIADLRFRNIVECVDDLRMVTLSMLNEHHEELAKGRVIGRIEYLPVQWHSKLHNDSTGVDQKLHSISLPSITKLRDFTNSTLLDILFYTSPTYCQTIVDTVGSEMKRLLDLFRKRNPLFKGDISVCGHSLGSSIMFDILYHQKDKPELGVKSKPTSDRTSTPCTSMPEELEESDQEDDIDTIPDLSEVLNQLGLKEYEATFKEEKTDMETLLSFTDSDMKEIGLPMGPRKKLMGYIKQYISLKEKQKQDKSDKTKARAEARAIKTLKESQDDKDDLSSSSAQSLAAVESVEVLFHQGMAGTGQPYVNYPQLNFKPFAMFALGSPIGMFLTVRGVDQVGSDYQLPSCPRFYNIFHPFDPVAYKIEPVIDPTFAIPPVMLPHHKGRKRMHLELRDNLSRFGANLKASLMESVRVTWESIHEFARAHTDASSYVTTESETEPPALPSTSDSSEDERAKHELKIRIGQMNGGNRIDYVLQEKPIESLNEYLFALSSHVCYWLSEDTALFMLREIYNGYPTEIQQRGK